MHKNHVVLVLALALALACAGFLPFNLRRAKAASVFMGDSGSQPLGFALGALGLSASWKVAGTTVATPEPVSETVHGMLTFVLCQPLALGSGIGVPQSSSGGVLSNLMVTV